MIGKARVPGRNQRVSSRKQRKQQLLLDVKVRSRKATSQRNRKVLAWLSSVILIAGAIGGAVYGGREALRHCFWQNPDYNLAEVAIRSDGPLSREQILAATGIREGANIFSVDLSTARKNLMALPQVDRAEVERVLPNKISIDITERKPVAWMAAKPGEDPTTDPAAYLIDRAGILIRTRSDVPDYLHLPVIYGVQVGNYEAGETIDAPEVKAALDLIHITGENPARYQVRSIDVSKGYCLVVTDEHHARVTFPLDNLEAQLDRLTLLMENVEDSNREIQTVNLLVQRNVPVTFVPPPEPVAEGTPVASPAPSPATAPKSAAQPKSTAPGKPAVRRAQPAHKAGYVYHEHPHSVRRAEAVHSATP